MGHGISILVRSVHVLGGNSGATREATASSNSSPIAAAAAKLNLVRPVTRGLTISISAHLEFRVPPHTTRITQPQELPNVILK